MFGRAPLTAGALLVCLLGGLGWFGGCRSNDQAYSSRAPYVPRVEMPTDLNRNEEEFLPEVEEALRRAGYDPRGGGDAEFALSFSVDAGPINADTALRLKRGRREVARSFARVGGPRMIFKRRQVIQESFDKALQSFERQLPQQGEALARDDRWRSDSEESRGNYARGAPDYSEDAERGTPYDQR